MNNARNAGLALWRRIRRFRPSRAMAGHLVLGLALLPPLPCQAQAPAHSAAGNMVAPWTRVPAVVVVGANANYARLPLVEDAVAF